MTQDQIASVVAGVAIAGVAGLVAGTAYVRSVPQQAPNPFGLIALVAGTGLGLGLLWRGKHPELAKGLMGGGAVLGLLSPVASSHGVFSYASTQYDTLKTQLVGPTAPPLALPGK